MKESTKTLQHVLRDNPNVKGNQEKIIKDQDDLVGLFGGLMEEIQELTYTDFKTTIQTGLDEQGQLGKLREQEKNLQNEIREIQQRYTTAQDEFAQQLEDNMKDI